MAWILIWLVIYIQLMDLAHIAQSNNETIRIGALFTEEEKDSQLELAFKYAVYRINKDKILRNNTLIYDIQYIQQDSFHATKKACLQVSNGVSAIFGPVDPELGVHIQSLCDALDIPHLEARLPNLGERDISKEFSINLHPTSATISESLRELIIYLNWTKVAIIYSDDKSLIGLQELVKPSKLPKNLQFVFRKCNNDNLREILTDIRSRNIYSMIVDIRPSILPNLLTAILQVQMNDYKYHYHFTTFDIETLDLENFRYNYVNMTSFRLVDSNSQSVRTVLHDIEKFQPIGQQILNRSNVIEASPALMFDSVYVLAYALNELLKNNIILQNTNATCQQGNPWPHGSSLFNYINLVEHTGLTGKIQFKEGVRTSVKLDLMKLRKKNLDKVGEWSKEKGLQIIKPDAFHEYGASNITLLVTTIEHPPYIMRKRDFNLTGNEKFEGFCIDLLQMIAEQLGFHYTLYLVPDNNFGAKNGEEWNGMVRELMDRKADLAVAPMTITFTRESVIDFSKPYMSLGIGILFRIPTSLPTRLFSFMNPLAVNIWFYVLAAYIVVGLTLYVVSQFSPYEWKVPKGCHLDQTHKDYLTNQFSIGDAFWFLCVTLMKQGVDLNPKAFSTRIIGAIWWFFTLILISSYTANLAAFLTVERMITPIEDVEDLAQQTKIQYGTLQNGSTMTFFRDSKIPTYQKMWKYMNSTPNIFVQNYEQGLNRVLDGNYAFLMESTMLDYMVQRDCNLTQVGYLLDSKGYGIATPRGSPWRDKVSLAILDLQEKGVLQMLYDKWWKSGLTCIRDEIKNKDANPLDFQNIGGVFVVLFVGLLLAIAVALIEFVCRFKNSSPKTGRQSLCTELIEEFRFAIKCGASRQRPVLKRSCSNCSLAKSGKNALAISRFHSNFPPNQPNSKLANLNSLSNGNLQLISHNGAGSFPHLHQLHPFNHQLMHQNSNISSSANRLSHRSNLKNYKFSSFNNGNNLDNLNYNRSLNEFYGLPVMPYSLQNLLLLDSSHNHRDHLGQQFNGVNEIPTPPLPPNLSTTVANYGLHHSKQQQKPLIKQRSLAAIDLDQYSDAHFQHHLQQLAHQFNQLPTNSRQLNLHRTVSTDNFDKCNSINHTAIDNPINQAEDLIYTSQDYSPDLDVHHDDNQAGN